MQVSLKYAEEHFADLISAVNRGEEVEIAQAEKPSIKLVPYEQRKRPQEADRLQPTPEQKQMTAETQWRYPERPRAELFGCLKGKLTLPEDWNSPETNQEVAELFENSRIFPETST